MCVKHMSTIVSLADIPVYLVGRDPPCACILLQCLRYAEGTEMPLASYVFESKDISFQHQSAALALITLPSALGVDVLLQARCTTLLGGPG